MIDIFFSRERARRGKGQLKPGHGLQCTSTDGTRVAGMSYDVLFFKLRQKKKSKHFHFCFLHKTLIEALTTTNRNTKNRKTMSQATGQGSGPSAQAQAESFRAWRSCAGRRGGGGFVKGVVLGAVGVGLWTWAAYGHHNHQGYWSEDRSDWHSNHFGHRREMEARMDKLMALQMENAEMLKRLQAAQGVAQDPSKQL
mmetsp:Transcript_64899/g.174213  ORF Transcript_64899/g.174213 Transcript_64899/m.174213 type:complete len:197 (+) Transcript_64899:212-802(+)